MKINADFSSRVIVHSKEMGWFPSPVQGVERRPLDRVGGEVARATSIVRYAPGAQFSPHIHGGGEEFIVLSGVFQDEQGVFPAGSYVRNPPHSSHKPVSEKGCIIFVKLWQFDPADDLHVQLNINDMKALPYRDYPDIQFFELHKNQFEEVLALELNAKAEFSLDAQEGAEILVLEGELTEKSDRLTQHDWMRLPENSRIEAKAGAKGASIWMKLGHLSRVEEQISRIGYAQRLKD